MPRPHGRVLRRATLSVRSRRPRVTVTRLIRQQPMGIWNKLFGDSDDAVDYYAEGVELMKAGKYHEALTSFRLALRDAPTDAAVLQQMAVTYTRIGMTDEALKTYRTALAHDESAAGAHYGLAFLLLHGGRKDEATRHLRTFLEAPPHGPEAQKHVEHARRTLEELTAPAGDGEETGP